ARASAGTSTAGAPPKGLSPPTLTVRTGSGRALMSWAQPRNAIDAAPSAIVARVPKNIMIETDFRKTFSIGARTTTYGSPARGVPRLHRRSPAFAHAIHYKDSATGCDCATFVRSLACLPPRIASDREVDRSRPAIA